MPIETLLYALSANLCFALASLIFAHYSKINGSFWMNWWKAFLSFFAFLIVSILNDSFYILPGLDLALLLVSGFIGLGLGDYFLLDAFAIIGPGRTLMLFAFQPLFLGAMGSIFFGQEMNITSAWAIVFFMICTFIFSLESFKEKGHWEKKGILRAFLGMFLDALGLLLTKKIFETHSEFSSMDSNLWRCLGALVFFALFAKKARTKLFTPFLRLVKKDQWIVSFGALFGTFVSLGLYLQAIKTGHLASISGIAITAVVFSSLFECLYQKRKPSAYLIVAFLFFLIGMKIMLS